jgi:bacteriorhodopsin
MKMKYVLVFLIAVVFLILTVASPAMAGSKSRHRWQGFAIGFGAAILGQALLNHHQAHTEYEGSVHR